MSKASAVPVEPQEQTNLLEESILAPGVIGGTVPGGECLFSRQATSLIPSYQSLSAPSLREGRILSGDHVLERGSEGVV